jgi:outer membrane PBP1 activator LpoA protein
MTHSRSASRFLAVVLAAGVLAGCAGSGPPQPVPPSSSSQHYLDRFVPRP